MLLVRGVQNLPKDWRGCALTIGNFDGLHLGHRALIERTRLRAQELGLPLTVMCFEPTPREYFRPQSAPGRISNLRSKLADFEAAGVEVVVVQRFGKPFCTLSGLAFIDHIIHQHLRARAVIVGDDFNFGAARSGDMGLLRARGAECGFTTESVPSVVVDGERCSSTAIREALAIPDLSRAARMLGRPYRLLGHVRHGLKLGRELGMPTANLYLLRPPALRLGIYAVEAQLRGEPRPWKGVAALGVRPTLGLTHVLLETHLFEPPGDIYGARIEVEFRHFLRPELRFDSLDALKVQMQRDKLDAMALLR
ncbi:bifunctional riboflavin kinase/FAD synthetase [Solimonas soli]|uniref:bifunctional riboflavin kinase/FAD synthetase n=1 Tax=Solimonas soli TaxID=413479 RepID=UPI000483BC07|nr:bifunctional riboflavin kinase/FAD synthetase [Solimonas soli]